MFRRLGFFLFFLIVVGAGLGAVVATGLVALNGADRWLAVGLTVLVLIGLGLVVRQMFRRTWGPVGELIDATGRLGEGDHEVRLQTRGRGPLTQVAISFNRMAERLGAEDLRRRRLLADIGHELRTPMTVIRGEIEAVLDGMHQTDQLGHALDEVDLMERLLDDLRVLSMAEAGTLRLEIEPTDVVDLVESVAQSFEHRATKQGVGLSIDVESGVSDVAADPHRLHQVVSNLVGNALDQMPDGGSVHIEIDGDPDVLRVRVSDTGPGIPPNDLERVFDRFVRSSDSAGTGLGLSISRDLVAAHGGTLTAANRPDGGAVLTLALPLDHS